MTNAVNDVISDVGKAVNTAVQDVGNVVTAVVNNPIPIIETIAVTYLLGPEGLALSESIGATGTSAVSSAAVAAANGAPVDKIALAAATAATGTGVSGEVAGSVASATKDATLANIAGSAAGSGAATIIAGGSVADILNNIAAGAFGAGTSAAASTLGASPTTSSALGGYVGGATQAGGTPLTGLASAAGRLTSAYTPTPSGTVTKAEAPIVDLTQGTQVAGPGGIDPRGFQPGTITQTATGLFTTFTASDGTIVNIPITVNQNTGEIKTTSTDPEALNAIKVLKVDSSKINPVFLDRTPISPNLSAAEQADLAKVTSNDMVNALKAGKSIDEYYNSYAYTQSLPVFANQIAQELANDPTGTDPTYNNMRAEYKKITGTDFVSPKGITDIGTINVPGPVTDLGEIIITAKVLSYDPNTQVAFIYKPDGTQQTVKSTTPLTPGNTVAVNTQTSQVIPTSVTNQTAADITTTTPTTTSTTDKKTSTATTTGTSPTTTTTTSTFPTVTDTTTSAVDTFIPTLTEIIPDKTTTSDKTTDDTFQPNLTKITPTTFTDISKVTPTVDTFTPSLTEITPSKPPTGPSTEKTTYPEYKPDLFVYSNVPKGLAGTPFAQGQLPSTGQTVGLGGGAGGVSVESGKEQVPKWNIASLKLKKESEGTPDYGALSSALGI